MVHSTLTFFFKYIKEAVVEHKLVKFFDYPRNSLR
jgi:hypothetical protein